MSASLADVRRLDAGDPLRRFRERFDLPDSVIYLDGNSLGAAPRGVRERLDRAVADEWASGLVRSWNSADWIGAPARVGAKIARLIGARPNEVIVADSTSVNLFKLLAAALGRQAPRKVAVQHAAPTARSGAVVGIENFAFAPGQISVSVGEKVEWVNRDGAPHGLAFKDGAPGSDHLLPGQAFSRSFAKAGDYDYICSVHPYMTARVTVRER